MRQQLAGLPRAPLFLSDTPARFDRYWSEDLDDGQRQQIDKVITDAGRTPSPAVRASLLDAVDGDQNNDWKPDTFAF